MRRSRLPSWSTSMRSWLARRRAGWSGWRSGPTRCRPTSTRCLSWMRSLKSFQWVFPRKRPDKGRPAWRARSSGCSRARLICNQMLSVLLTVCNRVRGPLLGPLPGCRACLPPVPVRGEGGVHASTMVPPGGLIRKTRILGKGPILQKTQPHRLLANI